MGHFRKLAFESKGIFVGIVRRGVIRNAPPVLLSLPDSVPGARESGYLSAAKRMSSVLLGQLSQLAVPTEVP